METTKITFRASQVHKLMTGTIGLTEVQEKKFKGYQERNRNSLIGKAKPLTPTMMEEFDRYIDLKNNPPMPKTMETEIVKVWRSIKYKRDFDFTNKYVQKGIQQEEEGITLFQSYLAAKGYNTLFTKNTERFYGTFFQGEPDLLNQMDDKIGYDIKCSWDLDSFPVVYPEGDSRNELDEQYECQNQVYMHLTGRKEWWTVYCLVNCTEHHLYLEKEKFFYAYSSPSEGDKFFEEMERKQRNCEIKMIYDYDRFTEKYSHLMIIPREEWHGEGFDIPMADRVIIKKSFYDPEKIKAYKERAKMARRFIKKLEKSAYKNNTEVQG